MVAKALWVTLEAKPGKEAELEKFLHSDRAVVQEEKAATAWFALQMGPSTYGIFDIFPDEKGRNAHLTGKVAAALMAQAPELLASNPVTRKLDVLADTLTG